MKNDIEPKDEALERRITRLVYKMGKAKTRAKLELYQSLLKTAVLSRSPERIRRMESKIGIEDMS